MLLTLLLLLTLVGCGGKTETESQRSKNNTVHRANDNLVEINSYELIRNNFNAQYDSRKTIDDMKAIFNNTEYDTIWKMLGFSDAQIKQIRTTLNPPYNGNYGMVVGESGALLYRYLPRETAHVKNFRKDMFDMWLVYGPKEQTQPFLKNYQYGRSQQEIIDSLE